MQILRSDLARGADPSGAVVVIDVLRSFSTAAYALAAGACALIPAAGPAEVESLRRRIPGALAMGALPGGKPIKGLDLGNSPTELRARDVHGRLLIQHTAGGVRGLLAAAGATHLLAASLLCARATARYLTALDAPKATLVVTGLWTDRNGEEDFACADLIEAYLRGETPDPDVYIARVRDSDFGRRFAAGREAHLPRSDLDLCACVDRFDFAMPVRRGAHGLEIRAAPPPEADRA